MSNYSSLNSTNRDNITSINGVVELSVRSINANPSPPPIDERRARRQPDWICAFAATSFGIGKYGYANEPSIETADWTSATYQPDANDRNATLRGVLGKNVDGEGIYVLTQKLDSGGQGEITTKQLAVSGLDATIAADWTNLEIVNSSDISNQFSALRWAEASDGAKAGVWIGGTSGGKVFRSTDGTISWTEITSNMPGDTWETGSAGENRQATEIASDGNGTWVMLQRKEMFVSTNDGLNWSKVAHGLSNVGYLFSIVYTNNSFVMIYKQQLENDLYVASAAATDLTDFGTPTDTNILSPDFAYPFEYVRAAADRTGRVMFVSLDRRQVGIFEVSGKIISNYSEVDAISGGENARDIATDGRGNWIIAAENSDMWQSTDKGATWTKIVNGFPDSDTNIHVITSNVYDTTLGATRWVAGTALEYAGYASNSDLTSWTFYDRLDGGDTSGAYDVAYGKNGKGDGIYCMTNDSKSKQVSVSSANVADGQPWTSVNIDNSATDDGDQFVIAWTESSARTKAGVWMAVGEQGDNKAYYRSIDGAVNWSEILLSGITGHTGNRITALAGDGYGNWMMGQDERIYYSTNNGTSFTLAHTFTGENFSKISGMAYTGDTWVISYERTTDSGKTFLRSCSTADVTTWSSEAGGGALENYGTGDSERTTIVAYQGRILVVPHDRQKIGYADVSGTSISNFNVVDVSSITSGDNLRDASTDGNTWVICAQDGLLLKSTDDAVNWSVAATAIRNSTDDIRCIAANVHLPQ